MKTYSEDEGLLDMIIEVDSALKDGRKKSPTKIREKQEEQELASLPEYELECDQCSYHQDDIECGIDLLRIVELQRRERDICRHVYGKKIQDGLLERLLPEDAVDDEDECERDERIDDAPCETEYPWFGCEERFLY